MFEDQLFDEIKIKLKKGNKILFSKNSLSLKPLIDLVNSTSKGKVISWALENVLPLIHLIEEEYPQERRPRNAYILCKKWLNKEVKMPLVKKAILECHSVAKEIEDEYYSALFHAVGQGLSTIHVIDHSLGLVFYELTALVRKHINNYEEIVISRINTYIDCLKNI